MEQLIKKLPSVGVPSEISREWKSSPLGELSQAVEFIWKLKYKNQHNGSISTILLIDASIKNTY